MVGEPGFGCPAANITGGKVPEEESREPGRKSGPDRRRFLAATGAAGAAGAAAVGGLIPATPAMADRLMQGYPIVNPTGYMKAADIAGNPYVKAYPELARRPWIPGYGFAELPCPTEPGAFLSDGLKKLFGVIQRCLCSVPGALLNLVGLGVQEPQRVEMHGGVAVVVGGGQDNLLTGLMNVILHPGEHISRGIHEVLGVFTIGHPDQPTPDPSFIIPIDTEQILNQFIRIVNPLNWPEIIINFVKNPLSVFDELLHFFFPVKQHMRFHIECKAENMPGVTLVNRNQIEVINPRLEEFPPRGASYHTPKPVELVDKKNPNGRALAIIEDWSPTVTHRKGLEPFVLSDSSPRLPLEPANAGPAASVSRRGIVWN
jgi:hypothetical protein